MREESGTLPTIAAPTTASATLRFHPTHILQSLRASYWFVPTCMVLLAIGLALLMPWVDSRHDIDLSGSFGWVGQTQTDGAREVLGAIAGSVIGVAGTTFSITMVAVSFASSNFGPRMVGNFMRDRGNQITLGTFIATFVYCLLVLRRVHGAADSDASASYGAFVPHLSVLVALGLALASVGVLIYFIHHVPETIDVDRLVAGIGRDLRRRVSELFPQVDRGDPDAPARSWDERVEGRSRTGVTLDGSGFVQALELGYLGELAAEHSLLIRVQYRPGDFVIERDAVMDVWSGRALDDGLLGDLRACFALGRRRTGNQNCLFLAEQLVEVIGRALSPGVNDPFTAIACFDWLKGAVVEFMRCDDGPAPLDADDPVQVRPIDFERFANTIFDRTRQYVCSDRNVSLHVLDVLVESAMHATRATHRDALTRRMDALLDAAREAMPGPVGGDDVAARHTQGMRLLNDPDAASRARDGARWYGGQA